ncbi:hypothetical protein JCM19302_1263 [Jejuia pallidilutea]|uniref:Uncharacterized protein n=2 Tax=Jejuia pallidilutea TaxID=504487 RepID=A0A090W6E6_9FLAO|nr:hypothetical protein JCM19302_1263 [Jejuia pallidilutea]
MNAHAINPTNIAIIFKKYLCFPIQKRAISNPIKIMAITASLINVKSVFTFSHSIVTSAITPIMPIHEDTIDMSKAKMIKITGYLPK